MPSRGGGRRILARRRPDPGVTATWREREGEILLTPKFGKESDLWVRFEKESVRWKERYLQRFSAKRSAVGYLLQFGKGTVELILQDWTVTWLKSGETNGWTGDRV
jgi:hypothetical protein